MKRALKKISILVALAVSFQLSAFSCFAATQIPVTARVTVAPEGQYGPIITVSDQTVREGESLDFEVLATDANTEDTVTLEVTAGQPPWLTIISNVNGNPSRMSLRAAPPAGTTGKYTVTFTATDNSPYALSTTKSIFIIVNPANQVPVITAENQTVQINNTLTFTVTCGDPDSSDIVMLTYTGKPSWLAASLSSPATGNPITIVFTGKPLAGSEGTYTMVFEAVDDGTPQQKAAKTITITVSRFNRPPVLAPIRNKEVPVRVKLEFSIEAMDPDGDVLNYSATGLPLSIGANFDTSTRKFSWTPTDSQVGNYQVRFEVSDGVATDYEDITIYVSAADAPVFDHPFREMHTYDLHTRVGETLSFAVTARDPNGDPITYSASNLPQGATFDPLTQTFAWTPGPGQEGTYPGAAFMASDGRYTTTRLVTIYVNPSDAPIMERVGEKYVRPGQLLTFTLNARDPNGLPLTYSVSNNPAGSSLTGPVFTWTPTTAQIGTYPDVIFTASNGAFSDSEICWIFVLDNGSPIIEKIGEKHVVEGRTLTFTVNATDPDGDALTYLQPLNVPKGSYFDPATHTFTWTPAIGETGVYNDIIFKVTDGISTVEDRTWIFVAANDAPVVEAIPERHVKALRALSFSVSAYDPNGDNLTYRALNLPDGATFSDRTFRWTPTLAQVGAYKDITFEVSDGVYVVPVSTWVFVSAPGAPLFEQLGEKHITAGNTLTFIVSATDPDGDNLIYSASNLPAGSSFNPATQTFTWTPAANDAGVYPNVLFHVTDGVYTDTVITWIFVKSASAPTIYVPGEQRIRAGNTLEFTITASDPDTPAGQLVYAASNMPPGATFVNQIFRWTPAAEQIGTYPNITFTVSDGTSSDSNLTWIFVTSQGAPQFTERISAKYGRVGEPIVFSVSATDPDDPQSALAYYGINLPVGAIFDNQTFRWTPQPGQAGAYKDVRIEVKDPNNNIDANVFWIFVSDNNPPELDFIGTRHASVGVQLTFIVTGHDIDGDTLAYSAGNLPAGATFNASTRQFSWTPSIAGTYTGVHFEVSDGALTDSEDISIEVSP